MITFKLLFSTKTCHGNKLYLFRSRVALNRLRIPEVAESRM